MAIRRTTAGKRLAQARAKQSRIEYPQAAEWALRALITGKGYRAMAAQPMGPDASILELLGMPEQNKPIRPRELLQLLKEALDTLARYSIDHPLELENNLSALQQLLGLSPTECDVLALMVYRDQMSGMRYICDLNERTERLHGFITLLACMLDRPVDLVRDACSSGSTLFGSGLLVPPSSYRDGPLELSPGLADLLLHHSDAATAIQRQFSHKGRPARHCLNDFQHIGSAVSMLTTFLQGALEAKLVGVNILIHGRPGTGKTQLTRSLADSLGVTLHEIRSADNRGLPIPAAERFSSYRYCQSLLADDKGTLLLFDECDDVLSHGESVGHKAWINNILEENPRPTFWLCNDLCWFDPAFIRRFDLIIEMPALSGAQRLAMATQIFAGLPVSDKWLQQLVEQKDLQVSHLTTAAKVVKVMACPDVEAAEAVAERVLDGLGSALGLDLCPQYEEDEPAELTFAPSLANADQDLGQLIRAMAKSRTGRLCLSGPPGTGKSQFTRHLAEALKVPLIVRRASDLLSPYVGQSAHNIATAFAEAARRNGVLLIDEADGLLHSRYRSHHQWEVSQVNELLQQMERYHGILIMTTNYAKLIDHAALRRFDLKIRFDYLTPEQSCRFFRYVIGKPALRVEGEFLRHVLRDMQLTPGDFNTVLRRSRVLSEPIDEIRLLQGLRQEHAMRTEHGGMHDN